MELNNEEIKQLRKLADGAKEHSHSPYSHFRVGASLLSESGAYFSGSASTQRKHILVNGQLTVQGCNIENASYGLCICAERTALSKAVVSGHTKFKAIAVTRFDASTRCARTRAAQTERICSDMSDTFVWPCGSCRQFSFEVCTCANSLCSICLRAL
jgi:cytidine deaminase